jgi:hypothetical protein
VLGQRFPVELGQRAQLVEQIVRATGPAPSRLSWTKPFACVFRIDISVCSRYHGPMRIVRVVTHPDDM